MKTSWKLESTFRTAEPPQMEKIRISSKNSSPPGEDSRFLLEVAEKIVPKSARVLDLGTGSGFLAITLSKRGWTGVTASDIDNAALEVARENALKNSAKVDFFLSDLFSETPPIDWVLFNPPILGKPAGKLSAIRRIPGISIFSGALSSIFRKNLSGIVERFLSELPKSSKGLIILPRNFRLQKGLLVGRNSRYSVYLVGSGISPPQAPRKKFKKRLPWE